MDAGAGNQGGDRSRGTGSPGGGGEKPSIRGVRGHSDLGVPLAVGGYPLTPPHTTSSLRLLTWVLLDFSPLRGLSLCILSQHRDFWALRLLGKARCPALVRHRASAKSHWLVWLVERAIEVLSF